MDGAAPRELGVKLAGGAGPAEADSFTATTDSTQAAKFGTIVGSPSPLKARCRKASTRAGVI